MQKRRHHYVWQHYLKAWTVDGQLWCRRGHRTFPSGTTAVAVQTDFYRLKELTPADLEAVDQVILSPATPELQELNRGWFSMFAGVFEAKRQYEAAGRKNVELAEAIEDAISNIEENLHESIEREAIHQLAALRQDDLSFFRSDTEVSGFVRFISVQYMRTAKMRAMCLAAMSHYTLPGFDPERTWGLVSHIFATNIGESLYRDRRKLGITLVKCGPGAEFVTADQPVINLRGRVAAGRPEELELYYPISPTAALLIDAERSSGETVTRMLSLSESNAFNRQLLAEAHEQSYATNEALLRSYLPNG